MGADVLIRCLLNMLDKQVRLPGERVSIAWWPRSFDKWLKIQNILYVQRETRYGLVLFPHKLLWLSVVSVAVFEPTMNSSDALEEHKKIHESYKQLVSQISLHQLCYSLRHMHITCVLLDLDTDWIYIVLGVWIWNFMVNIYAFLFRLLFGSLSS